MASGGEKIKAIGRHNPRRPEKILVFYLLAACSFRPPELCWVSLCLVSHRVVILRPQWPQVNLLTLQVATQVATQVAARLAGLVTANPVTWRRSPLLSGGKHLKFGKILNNISARQLFGACCKVDLLSSSGAILGS